MSYSLKHRAVFSWNGHEYPLSLTACRVPPAKNKTATARFGGLIDIGGGRSIVLTANTAGGFAGDAADQKREVKPVPYDAKHVTRLGSKWSFAIVSATGEAVVQNMRHGTVNGMFTSASGSKPVNGARAGLPYNLTVSATLTVMDAKSARAIFDDMIYGSRIGGLPEVKLAESTTDSPSLFSHAEIDDEIDSLTLIRKVEEAAKEAASA